MIGRVSLLALPFLFMASVAGPSLYAQNTYTVNSTGDAGDANVGDGTCETSGGNCTLRAAIQEANQSSSEDTIEFGAISSGGEAVILPKSELPSIVETLVIDGTTEPNYTEGEGPVVVISGDSLSGTTQDGLDFFESSASGSRVQAVALVHFPEEGLEVHADVNEVTILGCYIGVGSEGDADGGNGGTGMWIGSKNNVVGTSEWGNVISGNGQYGIEITGDSNEVMGNRVGVNASGEDVLPNGSGASNDAGILVRNGSANDIVDNVIAGNEGQGVFFQRQSFRNRIRDNYIGTNEALLDLGNTYNGVRIDTTPEDVDDRNVVYDKNIIAFNRRYGINIIGNFQRIADNYIGTNENGDNLGNYNSGLRIEAQNVVVGRTEIEGEEQPGNVIGFNGLHGIRILEGAATQVRGNYIGTDEGEANLGNGGAGIEIAARRNLVSNDHQVGYGFDDPVPNDPAPSNGQYGNVIAYNGTKAIFLEGAGTTVGNTIRGNLIHDNGTNTDTSVGIDLANDGPTDNDPGDEDGGPNNLQNAPEFDHAQTQYNPSSGEVEVRYKVDSEPSHSEYGANGLKVDFYLAEDEARGSGQTYLYTDEYPDSLATSYREFSFEPPSGVDVSGSDYIGATATDAEGNTSEFASPSPLAFPVELASFEVEQEGDDAVRLRWQTTSEVENGGFRIEHRKPSVESFAELDFVEGKGTTDEPQDYSYRVEGLDYGTHVFRLVQVGTDGVGYHLPERRIELNMEHRYVVEPPSPNPTRREARFEFGVRESQHVRVTLYDALGREVRVLYDETPQAGQTETIQIDGQGLSSGRYFVRLTGEDIQEVMSLTMLR